MRRPLHQIWTPWRCVLLHGAVCAASLSLSALLPDPSVRMALCGVAMLPTLFFIGVMESSRYPIWLTPITFYCFWSSLTVGLSAIWLSQFPYFLFFRFVLLPEDVWKGLAVCMVGNVMHHVGLQLLRPRDTARPAGQEVTVATPAALVLLWGLGAALVLTVIPLGSLRGIFTLASNAALLAFALIPPARFGLTERQHSIMLATATALTVAVTIPLQSKLYPMLACIPIFMHAWQRPALRKSILPVAAAGVLLYLTVWGPIVNPSRLIRHGSNIEKKQESFRRNSPLANGDFTLDHYRAQTEALVSRLAYSRDVAFEVREADTRGHRPELFLDNLAWGFLPRALFPEKPWISRGAWFTSYVGFSRSESEATCSTAMYVSGELYWSFGWPGVILGNLLLGALASGLWRLAGTLPVTALRAMLYTNVLFLMGEVAEASSALITIVISYALFGVLLYPKYSSRTVTVRFRRWSRPPGADLGPLAPTH